MSRSAPDKVPVLSENVSLAAVSVSAMAFGVDNVGVSFAAVRFTTRFAEDESEPSDTVTA